MAERHRRKRVMRDFVIHELSAVDSPSQKYALAVLMKRADDKPPQTSGTLKNIHHSELSLADRPASPRVTLFNCDEEQEYDMQVQKIERPQSFDSFESAMAHLREEHGLSKLAAMEQVARANPELIAKFNEEGREIAKAAEETVRQVRTVQPSTTVRFDAAVADIMRRDGVDKLVAMERAALERPDLLAAYQTAG